MKDRPILFSAPMVRALLNCTKSQTRRIVKPQPYFISPENTPRITKAPGLHPYIPCPYGQPGDRLWVRETWQGPLIDEELEEEFHQSPDYFKKPEFCAYRATDTLDAINADGEALGWRPSIHMPRWASRILLEITAVRVERLADISKDDAMAEGIVLQPDGGFGLADSTHYNFSDPTDSYCSLWESINGAGAWFANPWVWVVEFQRAEGGA